MPELAPDVALRVKQNTERLLPPLPAPHGWVATVVGDGQVAWQQPDDKEIREGNGDPNGNLTAPKGTLYVERDAPALWINDDGQTSWIPAGTGAASSFPIVYDDGTYTHEITAVGGVLTIKVTENADPTNTAEIVVTQGDVFIDGNFSAEMNANSSGGVVELNALDAGIISLTAEDRIELNTTGAGGDVMIGHGAGEVGFFNSAAAGLQTVTGSRGGNAALASLLTSLANLGLIVDGTSA